MEEEGGVRIQLMHEDCEDKTVEQEMQMFICSIEHFEKPSKISN